MKNTSLRYHQFAMLSLLSEVDRICKKYEIEYMLFAGTLLGAVRHSGFIPWDDDADIIMPREDYERFLEIAEKEVDRDKFFVQREFSEHWPMFFSKLRLNGTACIERYHPKDTASHRGVYIDIFPCDNLSDNALKRKLQFYASKIVIAKSLNERGYLTDSKAKKIFMACCKILPLKPFHKFVINRKAKDTLMVHTFFAAARKYEKNVFQRAWFDQKTDIPFENMLFSVPVKYNELLYHLYGDYMTEPEESKRGSKVHAEIVDLENSYEKYNDIHKTLQFDEYTRSIR